MNRVKDPLLRSLGPDRLHYATGELLGADDFAAEQTYHRRQLARSLLFLFGSGSVAGLRVTVGHLPGENGGPDEVELTVEPGLALDRAGRLIEVPRDACLRLRRWFEYGAGPASAADEILNPRVLRDAWRADDSAPGGSVVADIFLTFHPCDRGYTPAFSSGPFDSLDASQPSRIRDAYELSLIPRPEPDENLPVAFNPWSAIEGATPEDRLASARTLSLSMWDEMALPGPGHVGDFRENPAEVDPAAVLLARLRIPAAEEPDAASAPVPDWSAATWPDEATHIDNGVRNVLLTASAALRVAGT